jgi:PAS domain-containing protein
MSTDVLKQLQDPSQLWIAVMAGGGLCSAAYLVTQHTVVSLLVAIASVAVIVVATMCAFNATRRLRRPTRKITHLPIRQIKRDTWKLRAIAGGFPDLIMVIDEDGRCLELFAGDDNCLEAPRGELLGRTLHDCLTKQSADFIATTVKQALDASRTQTVEYPMAPPSGFIFPPRLGCCPTSSWTAEVQCSPALWKARCLWWMMNQMCWP